MTSQVGRGSRRRVRVFGTPAWSGVLEQRVDVLRRRLDGVLGGWSLGKTNAVLIIAFAALILVYAGSSIGEMALRAAPAPVIQITVQRGDTLWSLAERYGSPNEYILSRVHSLAARNHLPAGSQLQPGQVLTVRVDNPQLRERMVAAGTPGRR